MTQKSILVVDDESAWTKLVKRAGERRGYQIEEACGISQAQAILGTHAPFNLIISDMNMPGGNGDELFRWIREHPHHQATPFLLQTADTSQITAVTKALLAGGNARLRDKLSDKYLWDEVEEMLV